MDFLLNSELIIPLVQDEAKFKERLPPLSFLFAFDVANGSSSSVGALIDDGPKPRVKRKHHAGKRTCALELPVSGAFRQWLASAH